jgi:hypothetical protein
MWNYWKSIKPISAKKIPKVFLPLTYSIEMKNNPYITSRMNQSFIAVWLFCIVLATSCKKDNPVGIDEIRLTEARTTDSTGNVASIKFQYDNEGRIRSYEYAYNHHTDKEATISYSGNRITIVYKPKSAFTITFNSSIWYTLNDDQMPVQRIQYDSMYVADPTIGQISIWKDTAWYKYNATGLLTNITGIKYDSTWFRQSQDFITDKTNYSSNYTNTENLLTQLSITASSTYRDMNQGKEQHSNSSGMEKYSFGYTQQYSNKVDFSNAALLAEFGVIFNRGLPLNKAYTYLPDKISFTDATGSFISDDLTFFLFSPVGYIESKTLKYDKNGFLSSITNNNTNSNKTDFFYNN